MKKIKASDYGQMGMIKENKGISDLIMYLGKEFLDNFPTEKDDHFFSHTYSYRIAGLRSHLYFYVKLYEYLDISPNNLDQYYWTISDPSSCRTKKQFKLVFENLLLELYHLDRRIYEKLILLNKIECIRLNEAMICLDSSCNLSSVVMSVSAVEHRLHKLLFKVNEKIYKKSFEGATLGGIIKLFRNGEYSEKEYGKFKKILPEKHKPLMEMLNIYRIFSAHPKDVIITTQTAKSILSLSFLLLVDSDLKV